MTLTAIQFFQNKETAILSNGSCFSDY